MADHAVVHIGENSPEKIAQVLMIDILRAEKQYDARTRKQILDTYAECLEAVRGNRNRAK